MTILNGWTKAELEVFKELLSATGAREGNNAFLGAIPDDMVNVWALDTGGGEAEMARLQCYGSEVLSAEIFGVFTDRSAAQDLVGRIKGRLSGKNNLNGIGNLQWFRPLQNAVITQNLEAQVTELSWSFEMIFNNV
jgi:hypothetical protein